MCGRRLLSARRMGTRSSPLVDAEPSRALLPESQPLVGPEEDPGDLFEPVANLPFAPPVEAVELPVVAPAPPSDLASNPEHTRSPSSESEPECRTGRASGNERSRS